MQMILVAKVVELIEVVEALLKRNVAFNVAKNGEDNWEITLGINCTEIE